MTLKGKVALITGCNRGIGKSILKEFAKNGAKIFAHARKESEEFNSLISEISKEYNVEIVPLYFDMTDTVTMKTELKNKIFKEKENINILVNSAGVFHVSSFVMTPISKIKEVFEINLFSQMELTQLILKLMLRQKQGSIINIGSIAGLDLPLAVSSYGVSKAALMAWTKTLALEAAQYGIRVNAIAPGLVDTKMGGLIDEKVQEEIINSCSMKRLANPDEIAKTAIFLASEDSSFINGQIIRVDGGLA